MSSRALVLVPALLGACTAAVVEERVSDVRPESDEQPIAAFTVGDTRMHGRAALALVDGRALLIDAAGALILIDPLVDPLARPRRTLLDGVRAVIELDADGTDGTDGTESADGTDGAGGRALASRTTDVGESDLWIVPLDAREPPRALAAARGADEMPFLLDDGRVLFVSTRSGVASLWVVALDGSGLQQLTNLDARPGALGDAFVPPPVGALRQDGGRVVYDAGDATWSVDLVTGRGRAGGG